MQWEVIAEARQQEEGATEAAASSKYLATKYRLAVHANMASASLITLITSCHNTPIFILLALSPHL